MGPEVFGDPSTFHALIGCVRLLIGSPNRRAAILLIKHPVAPLSIRAWVPTILPVCFQIETGIRIKLVFDPEINTGAMVTEGEDIGATLPFKKTLLGQGRSTGYLRLGY